MKKTLRTIAVLDLLSLAGLAAWVALGGGQEALSFYFLDVARRAQSIPQLAGYAAMLLVYAVGLELVLRLGIQDQLRKIAPSRLKYAGAIAAAPLYGAVCFGYGIPAASFAAGIGLCAALYFEARRDWLGFALWHAQWSWLAAAGAILCALAFPGAARNAFNYHYKMSQVEKGELSYEEGWGWLDRTHYEVARRRLDRLVRELGENNGSRSLAMEGSSTTAFGAQAGIVRRYLARPCPSLHRGQVEAAAAGMVLDMAVAEEAAQEAAGFFTGLRLSAWQFDDLPSVLRACLDRSEQAAGRTAGSGASEENSRSRFRHEAAGLLSRRVTEVAVPAAVERDRACWSAVAEQRF